MKSRFRFTRTRGHFLTGLFLKKEETDEASRSKPFRKSSNPNRANEAKGANDPRLTRIIAFSRHEQRLGDKMESLLRRPFARRPWKRDTTRREGRIGALSRG